MSESRETIEEEPTAEDVAEACKGILSAKICTEIAAQENLQDAMGLATTALSDAGVDAFALFVDKGITEAQ